MNEKYVPIGRITSSFGLKGKLKVYSSGDVLASLPFPVFITLKSAENQFKIKLISIQPFKLNLYLAEFEGIDSIEKTENLLNYEIILPTSQIPAPAENEFFVYELIGMYPVINNKIDQSFQITNIIENPANSILVFKGDKEVLIPFVNKHVGKIDRENKTLEIFDWEDFYAD
jgi:16S rRNA processing protein RimM